MVCLRFRGLREAPARPAEGSGGPPGGPRSPPDLIQKTYKPTPYLQSLRHLKFKVFWARPGNGHEMAIYLVSGANVRCFLHNFSSLIHWSGSWGQGWLGNGRKRPKLKLYLFLVLLLLRYLLRGPSKSSTAPQTACMAPEGRNIDEQ